MRNNWALEATGINVATGGQFAQNGRLKFDGNGNFSGKTSSSVNGVIVRHDVVGTYNMNNNCSFTATFTDEHGSISKYFRLLGWRREAFGLHLQRSRSGDRRLR